MEQEVGIPTTLFGGPPELGNLVKLGQSQKSFMNFFAQPLFESVADIMPAMSFAVNELRTNQTIWAKRIQTGAEKHISLQKDKDTSTGALSPRSSSPERFGSQPELSHPEGLPAQSHTLNERSLQADNRSRRSSQNYTLRATSGGPDIAADASRRSSGAFSSSSNPNVMLAPKRSSNSSPGQLQLAPDGRSQSSTLTRSTENKMPNRASEDTLSQSNFSRAAETTSDFAITPTIPSKPLPMTNQPRKEPISPRGLTGYPSTQTNRSISSRSSSDAPYEQRGHNRSSSGAHTNNTNASHATPYSPTETQATSVLTIDSDTRSAQGQIDSWHSRNGLAQPESHGPSNAAGDPSLRDKEAAANTPVNGNGGVVPTYAELGQRSIGKKSSRFNIFHSWKKRATRSDIGHQKYGS